MVFLLIFCLISLNSSTLLLGIGQINWIMLSKEFEGPIDMQI